MRALKYPTKISICCYALILKKSHNELADQIEDIFAHPEKINAKVPHQNTYNIVNILFVKLPEEIVESCYIPIIQSGGKYDLRLSAGNTPDILHFGTIVASLGARYQFKGRVRVTFY